MADLEFRLWIISQIDEQENIPLLRRFRQEAIDGQLREKAEIEVKPFETELKSHQLVDVYDEKLDLQAEWSHDEESTNQHHSNLLLINNCVNLLEKQKDLQHRFNQLSLFHYRNTDTDMNLDDTFSRSGYTIEPKNYDGTESFQKYLNQFQLISIVNKWDDIRKLIALVGCLRGEARSVLDSFSDSDPIDFDILKSKLLSSNTVRNQNMSLTNAVVDDIIQNQNLNANTHMLESVVQKAVRSERIRINSTITRFKPLKYDSHMVVRNRSVLPMNAAVDNTFPTRGKSIGTLRKITESDLGYFLDISEMSLENVILQLLGSIRFRPARSGSKGLFSEMSDFLMSPLTSLPFDGGGRIRMMTSCTSMPFDGGGWIRMIL